MAISGPIALYNNLPINAGFYQPSRFVISDITFGQKTTITTSVNHNYVVGQTVRLLIPQGYGSVQLNEKQGLVIDIPELDEVTIDLNSSKNVNPFIDADLPTQAQILPIGDLNSGYISSTGNQVSSIQIPGSFINIS